MESKGLVKLDCLHEESRWEYQDCKGGEETWRCLDCGELLTRYIDCGTGG